MMGGTGGYLVGYALAALAHWAGSHGVRAGTATSGKMALAILIGNVIIYVPGLLWLGQLYWMWDQPDPGMGPLAVPDR